MTSPSTAADAPAPTPLPAPRTSSRAARLTRAVLIANLVAQIGIVVTGGAVRLTGSGLGCSTWPQCEPGSFTPVWHPETALHSAIEFGNRTLSGVLVVLGLAVALLVRRQRDRSGRYRALGLVPVGGVLLQAVIGGITVRTELDPRIVGSHLLISMVLVAASTLLLYRWGEGDARPVPVVSPAGRTLGAALAVALVPVLVLGVIVTGSGPHSGDEEVGYRFAVDPAAMTRLHSAAVWLYLVVLVALLVVLRRQTAPPRARRSLVVLLALCLAQGAVGYWQFFTGLPELLVGVHMLGAALMTAATTWTVLTLRRRD